MCDGYRQQNQISTLGHTSTYSANNYEGPTAGQMPGINDGKKPTQTILMDLGAN